MDGDDDVMMTNLSSRRLVARVPLSLLGKSLSFLLYDVIMIEHDVIIAHSTVDGWQCAVKEISLEMLDAADSNGFEAEIQLLEKLPPHK